MKNKNRIILYKLVLIAIFSALSFAGTCIQIPLPTGGMIHLGNFVVIIAALLCGGLVGGLAGGIGCGLYDLIFYASVEGLIRYFILKLVMGLIVGYLFRFLIKKDMKIKIPFILLISGALLAIATTLVLIFYNNEYIKLSSSITEKTSYIIMVSVFGYFFSLLLIISGFISKKFKVSLQAVAASIAASVIINIILEFLARLATGTTINGLTWEATLVKALSTMPSCIFTGTITLILGVLIYKPLYLATKPLNQVNEVSLTEEQI